MARSISPGNARLRALISESGWSYEELARAVRRVAQENGNFSLRTNKSAVAHWVNGVIPGRATSSFLAEVFSRRLGRTVSAADIWSETNDTSIGLELSIDPVATIVQLGKADLERRDILAAALYSFGALAGPLAYKKEILARGKFARSGTMIGAEEVAAVNHVTGAFAAADEILGGHIGRSALIQFLITDIAAYCSGRFVSDIDRSAMFGAAAAACYLIGFKSYDAGMDGTAERYYLQAFQLATESDPFAHSGYMLRAIAQHSIDVGRSIYGVSLAEGALSRVQGKVDAETESLFWLTIARAAATDHDRYSAMQALRRAEIAVERSRPEQRPNWLVLGGPAEARLTSHTAKTLMTLRDYTAAEKEYARCAQLWNPVTHPRIHALTLVGLGEAQCKQGKVEQACFTWSQVIEELIPVRSARTRRALVSMKQELSAFKKRGVRGLADLEMQISKALS